MANGLTISASTPPKYHSPEILTNQITEDFHYSALNVEDLCINSMKVAYLWAEDL